MTDTPIDTAPLRVLSFDDADEELEGTISEPPLLAYAAVMESEPYVHLQADISLGPLNLALSIPEAVAIYDALGAALPQA